MRRSARPSRLPASATIAGSYVLDGTFERGCQRQDHPEMACRSTTEHLASLKRFKDDVKEVKAGYECGFVFENYQ